MPKNMPTNTDTIKTNIHDAESTSPKSVVHRVNQYDDSSGKKNVHITSSGKLLKDDESAVNTKGAEKAHKNPATKPDQICRLPIKFVNFPIASLNC